MMFFSLLATLLFSFVLPSVLPGGVVRGASVTAPTVVERSGWPLPDAATLPALSARAVLAVDARSGTELFSRNADTALPIASLTKLMTVLLVLERSPDFDQVVTLTSEDNDPDGARLSVANGATLTVRELLAAALIPSANNATEALVRVTGVGEADFVRLMNDRARALGMTSTQFTDVTGLGSRNRSTVRDLLLLFREVSSYPIVRELSTTPMVTVTDRTSGSSVVLKASNTLVGSGLRIVAGKTGYTDAAGGCIALELVGNGEREAIIILLGSATRWTRFDEAHSLVDWLFSTTDT